MVGKRIIQFEEHLKVRLFHRTTRTTGLTDEGTRYGKSIGRERAGWR